MAMNIEAEIRDLKRRVGELEGSFGFLNDQVRAVHRDLLAFQERTEERFDQIDARFNRIDQRFDRLDGKVDSLDRKIDTKVDGLARSLPGIVRDVLSDYEIKSRKG
jgi:predicted  nucleic acid-binding Zn-ribbon protein